jgi:hypothetical protein
MRELIAKIEDDDGMIDELRAMAHRIMLLCSQQHPHKNDKC